MQTRTTREAEVQSLRFDEVEGDGAGSGAAKSDPEAERLSSINDWITDFADYTAHCGSPRIFREWGAVSAIATAIERKAWVRTRGSNDYPNLFIIFCSPPGVGKTEIIYRVKNFISELPKHHIARASLTKASLIDELNEAKRTEMYPDEVPAVNTFNALFVAPNELGVLLPAYDPVMMNTLQDLYDSKRYDEAKRTRDIRIDIERPVVNILSGCTPSYIMNTFPAEAWDQGFSSRTIYVYSDAAEHVDLFDEPPENEALYANLVMRLKAISRLHGCFQWTQEAMDLIRAWHRSGCQPTTTHSRLLSYESRRMRHVVKLAMCIAVSETTALLITADHMRRAINMLVEAEIYMPEIFKASATNSNSKVVADVWDFVFRTYTKEKRPVAATRVVNFVTQLVPAFQVQKVLEVMENAGLLRKQLEKSSYAYIPQKPEN